MFSQYLFRAGLCTVWNPAPVGGGGGIWIRVILPAAYPAARVPSGPARSRIEELGAL